MIKAEFHYSEDTKNKLKYQENPATNHVGTLYINKNSFNGKKPEKLIVTIEEGE